MKREREMKRERQKEREREGRGVGISEALSPLLLVPFPLVDCHGDSMSDLKWLREVGLSLSLPLSLPASRRPATNLGLLIQFPTHCAVYFRGQKIGAGGIGHRRSYCKLALMLTQQNLAFS